MARIPDDWLDCSIYLYRSLEDAELGKRSGGTGFLACVESGKYPKHCHLYAVTNRHVIHEHLGNAPVIRLNNQVGKSEFIDLKTSDWRHPDSDDIAVCPLELGVAYKFRFIPTRMFLTKETIHHHNIGIGDDTIMIGRFINHEGTQGNLPSARFGNISMMPQETIRNDDLKINQESFLVETRSLSGFSGSPVFVEGNVRYQATSSTFSAWLLGIDWAHLNVYDDLVDRDKRRHPDGWQVKSNSGMMAVVPAWKINEFLMTNEFVIQREERERRFAQENADEGKVTLDFETPKEL